MAQKMSKDRLYLNSDQYKQRLQNTGDMALKNVIVEEQFLTVADTLTSPIDNYITLAANNFGCGGTAEYLIVDYVHPLFLKAESSTSEKGNPNCLESTNGPFSDKYWKVMKTDIATLDSMGSWDFLSEMII